ncbi:MAG: hypothetical protein ACI86H_003091 [bacterium]|jgi:hypothetical protein
MSHDKKTVAAVEAHLQHEMKALQGEGLKKTINEEVSALFDFLETISLNDLVTVSQIQGFFQRNVVNAPIPQEAIEFLTECAKKVYSCLEKDGTKLEDILPKEEFDKLVVDLIEMEDLRKDIIHEAISSSIFSMMITDVLFNGIKGFVSGDHIPIPGASKLLKAGAGLFTKNPLAKNIDAKLKKFVEGNIQHTLKDSEKFLVKSLDEPLLKEFGDELWKSLIEYNADSLTEFVSLKNVESIASIVETIWQNIRDTSIFDKISKMMIAYFFERNGDKKIATLAEELGVNKELALNEINGIITPALEIDPIQKYIESRLKARLESYYFSV